MVQAENTAPAEASVENSLFQAGEFQVEQPDSMFVPYGETQHRKGLQVFRKEDGEALAAGWNSIAGKLAKWFGGVPVYVGHPDVPEVKAEWPDKRAYGWLSDIRAENDGMRLQVKWSPEGREMIENGHFRFYSPYWAMEKMADGLHPRRLISVGLTNTPNIPVPALANDSTGECPDAETNTNQTKKEEPMNPELLKLLGLEPGATDEDVLAKVQELKDRAEAAEAAAKDPAAEQAKADAEAGKAKADEEAAKAKTDAEAAENSRRAERQARIDETIDGLVTSGHLLANERECVSAGLLALDNSAFAARVAELRAAAPKLKTASTTGDLGKAKADTLAANEKDLARTARRELIAEQFAKTNPALAEGKRFEIATGRVRKLRPELFS